MMERAPVLKLVDTSPPQYSVCPISTAELRAHLRLPEYSPPIADQEARLEMLLDAAWEEAAVRQNRDLTPLTWDLTIYAPYTGEVQLRADAEFIDFVKGYDTSGAEATIDPATYRLDKERSRLVWSILPDAYDRVVVRHSTRGLTSIPEYLRIGVLLLAGYWYQMSWPVANIESREYPMSFSALLSKGAFPSACPR